LLKEEEKVTKTDNATDSSSLPVVEKEVEAASKAEEVSKPVAVGSIFGSAARQKTISQNVIHQPITQIPVSEGRRRK